ncbi:putative nuclease HARBI1 [Polypterus senegalus]|uniref:putative nuclease HARBI1 n=1 Tax=Polypterus senegalus TaxID=55291 RepID=UPI0019663292|nr:putative nuclease HARBI1 [Polypterus senegalus]
MPLYQKYSQVPHQGQSRGPGHIDSPSWRRTALMGRAALHREQEGRSLYGALEAKRLCWVFQKAGYVTYPGFPNVIGCIDGTHIPIKAPSMNEGDYVNRKSIHSINVQVICEATHIITNVEAKWPGSVHDARIFRELSLCQTFQQGQYNGYLLGDRGYPCLPCLMTPYPEADPGPQTRFNLAHSRTRAKVEMTIGILKSRFQCLRGLRVSPERACDIIVACVVLHNIATIRGESHPPCIEEDGPEEPLQIFPYNRDGRLLRDRISQNYFY